MAANMFPVPPSLLGGMSIDQFLAEYWQKKPLLIRQAIPGFNGLLSREDLFALACREEVESRYIRLPASGLHGKWTLHHGPQLRRRLRAGQAQPWTVLVQGLNLWLPAAERLLQQFSFIPQARLDDLMVSYAVDGGGVGPHFDNYDVFLLQGSGQRRWRIGAQQDRSLVPDIPLRILAHFSPEEEWLLEPGDLLYLPPHWAHDGVACGECTTYSIGFRAPTAQELGNAFLDWLQDRLQLAGRYADPALQRQDNSAAISAPMVDQIAAMLEQIRWQRSDIERFVGSYLSEPKAHVFFEPPASPLEEDAFAHQLAAHGFALDARSILLFDEQHFYLNGELLTPPAEACPLLRQLADQRQLQAADFANCPSTVCSLLYQWYVDGFGHPRMPSASTSF